MAQHSKIFAMKFSGSNGSIMPYARSRLGLYRHLASLFQSFNCTNRAMCLLIRLSSGLSPFKWVVTACPKGVPQGAVMSRQVQPAGRLAAVASNIISGAGHAYVGSKERYLSR